MRTPFDFRIESGFRRRISAMRLCLRSCSTYGIIASARTQRERVSRAS